MADFDLHKTERVQELLAKPASARDARWQQELYANIVEASFASPAQQIIRGPDGFPYFALELPPVGKAFTCFSIAHLLEQCTHSGYGIVIEPARQPPGWVFSYGELWSLRAYGQVTGDPDDEPSSEPSGVETIEESRKLLVGTPSDSFLPPWARPVLRAFLEKGIGLADPSVCLVVDAALRPTRNLVFNLFFDDPPKKMPLESAMRWLRWFLPPTRGVLAYNRATLAPGSFQPL
jgi:hypothetical protein